MVHGGSCSYMKMLMVKERDVNKNDKTPQVMKVKAYSILLSTSRTRHLFTFRIIFFRQI
jgi:hypothetical protein